MFSEASNDAFRKELSQWMYTQKNTLPVENKQVTHRVEMTPEQ